MGIVIISGVILGAVYVIVATGLTLTALPTGVFNFAQGAIVVGGSFLGYQWLTVIGMPFALALLVTTLAGALAGVLSELIAVRPLRWVRGAESSNTIVTTVGVSTALVGLYGVKWGYQPLVVPFPGPSVVFRLFGESISPVDIALVSLAVVAPIALHMWVRLTRRGQACLAVAENREASMLRGINVDVLSIGAFAAAGALGAVAGMATGPITYAIPTLGTALALGGFVALALGGSGSFLGGLAGGILVGLVTSAATRYVNANYSDVSVLVLLLITLALRPKGFGGAAETRRV
jgi:branched-chain amino acid transport system permease protein